MTKMYLCERCGISLAMITDDTYRCPRGHGQWTIGQAIRSRPLEHPIPNGMIYGPGEVQYGGGGKSGRKRKKPPKKRKQISSIYLERG